MKKKTKTCANKEKFSGVLYGHELFTFLLTIFLYNELEGSGLLLSYTLLCRFA